jgi:hypothetical protein
MAGVLIMPSVYVFVVMDSMRMFVLGMRVPGMGRGPRGTYFRVSRITRLNGYLG